MAPISLAQRLIACMVQGPMTRDELEDYHSQMDYWDLARDIFNTAFTRLFWATHGRGTSMDFAVSLLRAVRFATVIGMVM